MVYSAVRLGAVVIRPLSRLGFGFHDGDTEEEGHELDATLVWRKPGELRVLQRTKVAVDFSECVLRHGEINLSPYSVARSFFCRG